MAFENERIQILAMIDSGAITSEQGIELIRALGSDEAAPLPSESGTPVDVQAPESPVPPVPPQATRIQSGPAAEEAPIPEDAPPGESTDQAKAPFSPKITRWRSWWQIPLWIGAVITVLGGLLMFWALQTSGFGFWFACSWFPFFFGVAVIALAWSSRSARWLHLRVYQTPGEWPEKIAISLPLPLHLTAWFLRMFGKRIPNMENTNLDEIILALDKTSPEAPLYIEVDEGKGGERVEIYIG